MLKRKSIAVSIVLFLSLTGCSYIGLFKSSDTSKDEVLDILSKESFYHSEIDFGALNTNSFLTIFKSVDKYAMYFSKEEYRAYQSTLSAKYGGIGMSIYEEKNTHLIKCIPFDYRLIKKGISNGDTLIAIDDEPVSGKNFFVVSSKIRGKKGSLIKLKVKNVSGKLKSVNIIRTELEHKTIRVSYQNGIKLIKILEFTKETPDELLNEIIQFSLRQPIVIDLRNNIGGDLFSAIESADLFLPKDSYIVSIKSKSNEENYYALNEDYTKDKKIILIQNSLTASAAEVFIAALTENNRAESIGTKSFGKGVAQKIVLLSDGAAILFTYATLLTPNRKIYNNKGLFPTDTRKLKDIILENE